MLLFNAVLIMSNIDKLQYYFVGRTNESLTEEAIHRYYGNNAVMASVNHEENPQTTFRYSLF